eukprot:m.114764 g.114764  ORF g.114764 m.114764 type:complete len:627 (+) comp14177_c1_seq7:56-1936(+)
MAVGLRVTRYSATAVVFFAMVCGVFANPQNPHLIFVMVDDWGYYEAGFKGNALAQTPFMDDMLANDALLIERHYSYRFCSPARRSFLTGRLPPHVGQTNTPDAHIDFRMKTIAEKLATTGYATGHSGKWHAGFFSVRETPFGRGFSTSLGFLYGVDHWTQQSFNKVCEYGYGGNSTDLWDTDKPAWGMNGTYGDYMYVGHAVDTIMKHNTSTPLFYYLATEVAHIPNETPQRFQDKFDPNTVPFLSVYAMSSIVDEALHNVTNALNKKEMWDNTLMVVAADNGGSLTQNKGSNFPLRGGKYSWLEGGIRTTAWVTGGVLPPSMRGKTLSSAHMIAMCDWHSTFLALAGVNDSYSGSSSSASGGTTGMEGMLPLPEVDGTNQWPVLSGASTEPMRNEVFVGSGVLIQENYKLIATLNSDDDARWSGPMFPKVPATGNRTMSCSPMAPCLFDVVTDYREEHDLAAIMPDVVAKLNLRLDALMTGVFEADPVPNATQEKVCAASVANGMWITPYDWPSLPPTPPPPPPKPSTCKPPNLGLNPPPPQPVLPADLWLAFSHQWETNGSSIVAKMNCAVLKKGCVNSKFLPTNETHYFNASHVVKLGAPPKPTAICGTDSQYFEVNVSLPHQ